MNIQEFVLEQITFKLLTETLRDSNLKIDEKLGHLAIQIVEEENEEIKKELIVQYNKLKKFDMLVVKNLTIDDLDYKTSNLLRDKINRMVVTLS